MMVETSDKGEDKIATGNASGVTAEVTGDVEMEAGLNRRLYQGRPAHEVVIRREDLHRSTFREVAVDFGGERKIGSRRKVREMFRRPQRV